MESLESACAVCKKPATLRCSNCKGQFYCTKDHQRDDWQRHKPTCRAWEIKENPELGRYLISTRDLNPGDLIISELPIVFGPAPHTDQLVCVGCGSRNIPARCIGCSWPACRIDCAGLMDIERHALECQIIAKAKIFPRCNILLALRLLILRHKNPKKWKVVTKLQSHEEVRGPGTEAYEETKTVAQQLAPILSVDPGAAEILPKICGIIDVNALETNPPEGSVGIYENSSLLEHQCIANTRFNFFIDDNGRPRIYVKAVTFIEKLGVLLHPCHQHCITVGHSLIQLLPPEDPQKSEICKKIISTASIVDPYGAKLGLYTAIALRELASCHAQDKENLLSKAISLLEPEPLGSPGEKLLRLIESAT